MTDGMPKFLAKPLMLAAMEDVLRSPLGRACALLRVRDWAERFEGGSGPSLSEAAQSLRPQESRHADVDWFGRGGDPFWIGGPDAGPVAESVVGHGMREALEVALGLRTGESVAEYVRDIAERSEVSVELAIKSMLASTRSTEVTHALEDLPPQRTLRRDLPIDIYWICELPEFESYVSWNHRQVTFVIVTPPVDAEIAMLRTGRDLLDEAKASRPAGVVVVQRQPPSPAGTDAQAVGDPVPALLDERDYTKFGER
ncbi:MAG TPA: hypothetical protein VFC19_27195 [Candidatus Limnocylindrales bacterium]|nr:hypothetical protein [Candidatus Limnocylindrales bacterium]